MGTDVCMQVDKITWKASVMGVSGWSRGIRGGVFNSHHLT